jgi:hypothetical protein
MKETNAVPLEYTRITPDAKCKVVTIEFVVGLDFESDSELQEVIAQLDEVGMAEIISTVHIADDFDTAKRILMQRAKRK